MTDRLVICPFICLFIAVDDGDQQEDNEDQIRWSDDDAHAHVHADTDTVLRVHTTCKSINQLVNQVLSLVGTYMGTAN